MLMRLDLALMTEAAGRMVTGEAAGLAEEDREEAKPLVMVYMPKSKFKFRCLLIKIVDAGRR